MRSNSGTAAMAGSPIAAKAWADLEQWFEDTGGTAAQTPGSPVANVEIVGVAIDPALGIDSAYNVIMSNLAGSSGEALGGSTTAQFLTWDNDPTGIKVFILAGQSNMVGYGKTEQGGNPSWTEGGTEPKEITTSPTMC